MVRKYTLVDIILMVESFESMNVFSGRTNRALSGTSQNDDGTVGRTNRQRKKSNQVATSLTCPLTAFLNPSSMRTRDK